MDGISATPKVSSEKAPAAKRRGNVDNLRVAMGKGRPPGAANRTTRTLKEAILLAAQAAGGGGKDGLVKYLTTAAVKHPKAFLPLLGRVLPLDVTSSDGSARPVVAFYMPSNGRDDPAPGPAHAVIDVQAVDVTPALPAPDPDELPTSMDDAATAVAGPDIAI